MQIMRPHLNQGELTEYKQAKQKEYDASKAQKSALKQGKYDEVSKLGKQAVDAGGKVDDLRKTSQNRAKTENVSHLRLIK